MRYPSLLLACLLASGAASAGPLLDRILERRAQQPSETQEEEGSPPARLPPDIRIVRDIAYGSDARQRFDVYLPARPVQNAPVVFMVHGGAWRIGDKAHGNVVEGKASRWVPRGIIFISANYRMVPQADPLEQARDVARALAAAQKRALDWGADPSRFVLMGHSAGAHLVGLLAADPGLARDLGAKPWLGTVMLDSGAIDVPQIMNHRHMAFYDQAFGNDAAFWERVSPYHALRGAGAPLLAVCSSRRMDSCPQARNFADKAGRLGMTVEVLPEDMSHGDINRQLGRPSAYTQAVEDFLGRLDATLDRTLAGQ